MGVVVRQKPPDSGIWWVFVNLNGKRKAKQIGEDEELAHAVAENIKARILLGDYDMGKSEKSETFQQVADRWIALPHDEWKESTRDSYRGNLKKHILPYFGKTHIDQIKRKNCRAFFDKLLGQGLSPATVALIRAPFSGVMAYALDSELIDTNPLRDLSLRLKKSRPDIKPLTETEAAAVLQRAKKFCGGIYYPVMLTALRTGMRIGEIQALRWTDIDFPNRQIEVKRSWRKGRITGTKTHNRRRVDMTPHLAETLNDHRDRQKKAAWKAGEPFSEYVFTGKRDELLNRITFQNALNRCVEKAKIKRHVRTHDLRHSYATIRLMKGHNVGDVSYQLGHSSIKITYDIYAHWIPGSFKSEVDELDGVQPNATQAQPATGTDQDL